MPARYVMRPCLLGAALLPCACSDESAFDTPAASYEPLVTSDAWSSVARADDVFITEPELAPSCVGAGFFLENGWVEIDTTVCSWVTLEGAARFPVAQQQALRIVVSHFDLIALEPGQGQLRLRLGGCDAWQKDVAIPGAAAVYEEPFASPCAVDAGAVVQFHLHNHGQNNWQLQELAVLR